MDMFSALLAVCELNPPVTGEFLSHCNNDGTLKLFSLLVWTSGWKEFAEDLRRLGTTVTSLLSTYDDNKLPGQMILASRSRTICVTN